MLKYELTITSTISVFFAIVNRKYTKKEVYRMALMLNVAFEHQQDYTYFYTQHKISQSSSSAAGYTFIALILAACGLKQTISRSVYIFPVKHNFQ